LNDPNPILKPSPRSGADVMGIVDASAVHHAQLGIDLITKSIYANGAKVHRGQP
jgi:hypothetical protein